MSKSDAYARVYDSQSDDKFGMFGSGGLAISDTAAHTSVQGPAIFGYLSLALQTLTGSTLAGAWLIKASNDYQPDVKPVTEANAHWTDVTACFRTPNATTGAAIAAVTSGASSQLLCFTSGSGVIVPFPFRSIQVTFTATSGAGNAQTIFHDCPVGA